MLLGKLFLIPCTLGQSDFDWIFPPQIKSTIELLKYFVVENEKSARKFIKSIAPEKKQSEIQIFVLNKHTDKNLLNSFLQPCLNGENLGIISEAGCPGIADPGADIVKLAHQKGITVVPMVGPSSILLAMMSSGMNGQSFAFNGYLPIDKKERKQRIKQLERKSNNDNQSQIFIETPYRNDSLLSDLLDTLHPNTQLCIASDITLPTEYISTKSVFQWKKDKPNLHKRPTLFIL